MTDQPTRPLLLLPGGEEVPQEKLGTLARLRARLLVEHLRKYPEPRTERPVLWD